MTDVGLQRSVRIPRLLRVVTGVRAAAAAVLEFAATDGRRHLIVHSGALSSTGYGRTLAEATRDLGMAVEEAVVSVNDDRSVDAVMRAISDTSPAAVVGVGGGRIVDVAKLAAARSDVDFVSIPTQAASDGICSPVAVIIGSDRRPRSLGARIPAAIVVDLGIIRSAPLETWRAGLGDLVSNLSAVLDWRLAHETVGEPIDDFACLTAEAAASSMIEQDADLSDPEYQARLIRGLILSGIAMEMSGSSRPASGSEHLISHALDQLLATPRAHGLQVALGTVASDLLRGDPVTRLVAFYRVVGLPVVPAELGIEHDVFLRAVRDGRSTRPGRWTALDRMTDGDIDRLRDVYEGRRAGWS